MVWVPILPIGLLLLQYRKSVWQMMSVALAMTILLHGMAVKQDYHYGTGDKVGLLCLRYGEKEWWLWFFHFVIGELFEGTLTDDDSNDGCPFHDCSGVTMQC